MQEVLLVRYGEVHLKGNNRAYFMRALVNNIRKAAGCYTEFSDGRIYVRGAENIDETAQAVSRVFGVSSVSVACEMDKDYSSVLAKCIDLLQDMIGTFKVEARRSDKTYPMDSMALVRELGAGILSALPKLTVDVHKPQHVCSVEIREFAYVYTNAIPAVGGMPMGTNGASMLLLSGGIDSPVAGFMVARRGVRLSAVHFESPPYTGSRSREKVIALANILASYGGEMTLYIAKATDAQMYIHQNAPDSLGTILLRRVMMAIAQALAEKSGALSLITGESIGQVASQTMEALYATDSVVSMPVFRPVIGMDKLEITQWAKKIGTYETSILPYADCCTVFTPAHPATHPRMEKVLDAEKKLPELAGMIENAIENVEILTIVG